MVTYIFSLFLCQHYMTIGDDCDDRLNLNTTKAFVTLAYAIGIFECLLLALRLLYIIFCDSGASVKC